MFNILCLKHGTLYSSEYVNKLFSMVTRHVTLPHRFYCFTEDGKDLHPAIHIKPLPTNNKYKGWWLKPYLFSKEHFTEGTNFYLDLDMVILQNIDELLIYKPGHFVGMRDLLRVKRNSVNHLGSAIMRWEAGTNHSIWDDMNEEVTQRYHGDQDYIWAHHHSSMVFYPDEWINSYKWEYLMKKPVNGKILMFHGNPRPHMVQDKIVLENWK